MNLTTFIEEAPTNQDLNVNYLAYIEHVNYLAYIEHVNYLANIEHVNYLAYIEHVNFYWQSFKKKAKLASKF